MQDTPLESTRAKLFFFLITLLFFSFPPEVPADGLLKQNSSRFNSDGITSFNLPASTRPLKKVTTPTKDYRFARSDADFISDIQGLTGQKLSVVNGMQVHRQIVDGFREIDLVPFGYLGQ